MKKLLPLVAAASVVALSCPPPTVGAFRSGSTRAIVAGGGWRRRRRRRNCQRDRHRLEPTSLFIHFDDFSNLMTNNDEASAKDAKKVNGGHCIEDRHDDDVRDEGRASSSLFPRLRDALASPPVSYPPDVASAVLGRFVSSGFTDDNDVAQFAWGLVGREEALSEILMRDFGWPALDAHRARVGMVSLVRQRQQAETRHRDPRGEGGSFATSPERVGDPPAMNLSRVDQIAESAMAAPTPSPSAPAPSFASYGKEVPAAEGGSGKDDDDSDAAETTTIETRAPLWKSVLVNDKARIRRISKDHRPKADNGDGAVKRDVYNYGLTKSNKSDQEDKTGDRRIYENLYAEMDEFWSYMTVPRATTLADPILRDQTANVYMTHARLFLGWVVDARGVLCDDDGDGGDALLDALLLRPRDDDAGGGAPPSSATSSPIGAILSSGPSAALAGASAADSVRAQVWTSVLERVRDGEHNCEDDPSREESRGDALLLRRSASLRDVFPTPATESAAPVLQYVMWLRSVRGISPNYEANVLRGLIKLVKFRFAQEMMQLPSPDQHSGGEWNGAGAATSSFFPTTPMARTTTATPLDGLPIVTELRKLHREAGNRGKKAPRSSDEGKKWLEWSEYLEVIRLLKSDLGEMINEHNQRLGLEEKRLVESQENELSDGARAKKKQLLTTKSLASQRKEIATTFQHYLILSFFACVPDRQRTYRELQLGRNFIRSEDQESDGSPVWVIKHTAEDYKTGATYGERPPLPLTASLTPDIDDFIERWRPALLRDPSSDDNPADESDPTAPSSSFLFHQPRTGNPLTANSVFQIVSRCCYRYKQKKTNPHLLRDMIVTHVRKNADASEKELEALALFMGHSIQMQRDSYDRRTLEQKVSPAVKLMQDMNSLGS